MQDDLPDETLMQRIARNDTAAFDLLFRRHRRSVFSFTLRMVGDSPAAEDLTQECFLRVWRARDRYQPAAAFRTWLFTIARRLALDELKRRETHPVLLAAIWSGHITMAAAANLPKGDKLRDSVAALATDPTALQAVRALLERFFDGQPMQMTKAELAAAVGVPEAEIERSLLPLVADKRLRWSKTATGDEIYEIGEGEPHVALIQSLE